MLIPQIISLPVQPTRRLTMRRMDNGWCVWIAGTPATENSTYLYLYDSGKLEQITEGPERYDVVTYTDGETK